MLYTKNGSIPTDLPEGITHEQHTAAGWIQVLQPKPSDTEGKEVVWLNWSWVKREHKPEASEGHVYKWNHDNHEWVEYALPSATETPEVLSTEQIQALSTDQIQSLTTDQISVLSTDQIGSL